MRFATILVLPLMAVLVPRTSTVEPRLLGNYALSGISAFENDITTCFNTADAISTCSRCVSNGNGAFVKCGEPDGVKKRSPYVNAETHDGPQTTEEEKACLGIAKTYPDEDCLLESTDEDACGRSYTTVKNVGNTAVQCPELEGGGGGMDP